MLVKSDLIVHSRFLKELTTFYQLEWNDVEPIASEQDGLPLPLPILAIEEEVLVGGLAFTRFLEPNGTSQVIWINAVLIKPEFRGCGFASRLINRATEVLFEFEQSTLYVYTNVPKLYFQLGWEMVAQGTDDEHVVMGKHVAP
ncbi:GNAT family N-acetyltransferase [Vibrio sp. DW001]|uniref:GNAT family N-acetyltransferase n=1 Tax=Vibrio sp. DW001 TaxID=2912315 RepID=UPI0023AE774B|nr:GNAT family N-acetyltransferase [Vibrio sp. DW001]WED25262.1 GNAT family N-acetyltransferase [Vibrio sp. DW001]